ncbi:HNH endonuclease [Streptomyces sp. NPDC058471]|uniref:HNH endonuclease n=1 Tax=Streptomyces sp. NPDC058471 TaxID=3346516 RepID=UPI003652AF80
MLDIARRDNYCCGICDGVVPVTISGAEYYGPTIDHVVPLAMGGDDTRGNVQLAHRVCNSRKGARV